jgi:hypothetical protein
MTITFQDFLPGTWSADKDKGLFSNGQYQANYDATSKRSYWNDDSTTLRIKCGLLAIGTPIFSTLTLILQTAQTIIKTSTFAYFWENIPEEKEYSLLNRCKNLSADLIRIPSAPLSIIAITITALYGAITASKDARKIIASIERAQIGDFQGSAMYHLGYSSVLTTLKLLSIITLMRFWDNRSDTDTLKARSIDFSKDLGRILSTPCVLISLLGVAVFKAFNKNKGVTLHNRLVNWLHADLNWNEEKRKGTYILAPCFQPIKEEAIPCLRCIHAFGGDSSKPNRY